MTTAKKLTYTLQAVYEGKGDMKQLNADLKSLAKIEAFKGLTDSFAATNKQFVDAKAKLRELKGLLREPGGEAFADSYAKAQKQVAKLSTSLAKQKTKINESRDALKQSGVNVGELAGKYDALKRATEKQGRTMAAMSKLGVRSFADIDKEVDGLRRAYRDLERSGTKSFRELARAKSAMKGKISVLTQETHGWRQGIAEVHKGWLGLAGVIGTVAAASRGLRLFVGFDDSMRKVKAVSSATAEEFQQLTDFAKEMGRTTRFTATEAAQGMEELAQSGMDVNEVMKTLPHAMNLAAISGKSIKESADLATDTLKQFGLQVSDTGHVTDVLVKGYTGASTSLQQLGEALSYVGPVAASFGYSLEDTVSVLQTYAEAGFKGSRGGRSMIGALTRLIKPAKEAEAVLKKYNIQIFDSEGKVRDFADILEDLGKAALSPTEMMTLFGQEAGPGMAGLLSQGADAVRKFRTELEDVDGLGARLADDMESGIGGALRSLMSSLQAIVLAFADSWAPAISKVADGLTALARGIAAMPAPLKLLVSGITGIVAATTVWHLGLKYIFSALALGAGNVGMFAAKLNGLVGVMTGVTLTGKALALGLAKIAAGFAALYAGYKAGEWLLMHKHWKDIEEQTKANARANTELAAKFKEISSATGVTVTSMKQLDDAVKNGQIHFDQVAGAWVAGSAEMANAVKTSANTQKQVTGEALEEMKRKYQEYANEVKRLQDEISGRERSLGEELRAMSRTGMSDLGAWEDRKREAEEYAQAARAASEAGNFDEAVKQADKAKAAYTDLNKEIKSGDNVLVSKADALKTAMAGVEESGRIAIDALKSQQAAAAEAMDGLVEKSGFQDLSAGMDEAAQKWLENWQNMRDGAIDDIEKVEDRLLQIKDKEITVWVTEKERRAHGGLIGFKMASGGSVGNPLAMASGGFVSLRNMLSGGHFPGFGGGDRRHVVAEDGEVMIKKESVRLAGLKAALAFNAGRFDIVVRELTSRFDLSGAIRRQMGGVINFMPSLPSIPPLPVQHLAAGGQVTAMPASVKTSHHTIDFNFPGESSPIRMTSDRENLDRIVRVAERLKRLTQ